MENVDVDTTGEKLTSACDELCSAILVAHKDGHKSNLTKILELTGCTVHNKYAYRMLRIYRSEIERHGILFCKSGRTLTFENRCGQ